MAEAIDEAEAILIEIQSLPELKINTPVNKVILENIDVLLKLEGSQKDYTQSQFGFVTNKAKDTVFVIT
jgi:hypothetical protein